MERASRPTRARAVVKPKAADSWLRLSEDTPEASVLRATVSKSIAGEPPNLGGILAALRRSPLVGADLDLSRPREEGRKIDL
ncbi:hypothetical protein [Mesorhizobium sp.]|uniref:hypothetical protein n=1 Tax=Mesorhizobium sp. TaxID=1871066 RepID=UPI000FE88EC3|nr:hypothetical protein [Mesorhizobium sp.]RWN62636.1 MAG: hypothetical protein EOS00_08095 [Mesorhizobium sp.]